MRQAVDARLGEVERRGGDVTTLGDPEVLADRMVATLPVAAHPFDVELGPFYDTTGLSRWWGVSRQALADRVRRGTLLACRTADGHLVYPAFQFARDGAVRPGIAEAVAVFARQGVDGWTAAVWLTTASPAFDGDSAVDHLVVHRASGAAMRTGRATGGGRRRRPGRREHPASGAGPAAPALGPAELAGFPARRTAPGTTLHRAHLAQRGPWWFASAGGRFDLRDAARNVLPRDLGARGRA